MRGTKGYETALEANIYSSHTCHAPAVQVRLAWHVADKESQMAPVAFGPSPHGPAIPGRRPVRSPPLPKPEPTLPSLLCLTSLGSLSPGVAPYPPPPAPAPNPGQVHCLTDLSGGCKKAECGHHGAACPRTEFQGWAAGALRQMTPEGVGLEDTDVPASCFHPPGARRAPSTPPHRALTWASRMEGPGGADRSTAPGTGGPSCPARRGKAGRPWGGGSRRHLVPFPLMKKRFRAVL